MRTHDARPRTEAARLELQPPARDVDRRVLLVLVMLAPIGAAVPFAVGAPPWLVVLWTAVFGALFVRWLLFPRDRTHRATRRRYFRAEWPTAGAVAWLIPAACLVVVCADSFHLAYQRLHPEPTPRADLWEPYARLGAAHAIAVVAAMTVLAPVMEELFFRGGLTSELEVRLGAVGAQIAAAVVFAVFHAYPWAAPELFLAGLLLGGLTWGGRSVWIAAAAHGTWNAFTFSERFWPAREATVFAPVGTPAVIAISLAAGGALVFVVRQMRRASRLPIARDDAPPPTTH